MGRRQAREGALQMLYAWDIGNNQYELTVETIKELMDLNEKDNEFMMILVNEVIDNTAVYDKAIARCLKGWELNRLSYLDRNILRIALVEMVKQGTPKQVVANEAVEIAKSYSEDKSFKYINGVLGNSELLKDFE
ncbi:transcription antitermination factor NusB [Clostridium sp. 'deep sea']|uniref:transcription antitermination factor NusB n=1 Tax=Clostridium sp. 'deep sea' TaxID=2779445 RepID=UPI0018969517|nr:transcription antitermination factor NusB [Clostridium sp. 'deep sea']QOR35850.1 transcription antitermination factor NusB [Clostridium sp. 'deep sea']